MNKTTNYQLTLWDYGDEDFTPKKAREDWAANFTKLDAALKAEETARVNGLAEKTAVVFGVYIPDNTEERFIHLGFPPKAVLVVDSNGEMGYINSGTTVVRGGLALPGHTLKEGLMELTANGFIVRNRSGSQRLYMNQGDTKYYLAFR